MEVRLPVGGPAAALPLHTLLNSKKIMRKKTLRVGQHTGHDDVRGSFALMIILLADLPPAPVVERPFHRDRKRRFA
ncbi:hypothetical protein [Rhizobium rhizogenes]|uniref:hypothetical protein n=1 Tax=Rhizobium rhizogenes TaxID=359 RepID=UPI001574C5AF|nr:hypothetical protein [Rhizobium rhizogenes]NTF47021.1 hypothetical protein [Rhizobium rhizogenes]